MSKNKSCPICDQTIDLIVTSFRNRPFVDGKTYPYMCFGCSWVPYQYEQIYKQNGELQEELGPFFDHKHLCTPEELFSQGSTSSLIEAKRCVWGVKKKIQEGKPAKNLTRPSMDCEI